MSEKETVSLQNRTLSAMVMNAFFSLPSALIVALFIVLTGLSLLISSFPLSWPIWLLFGILGEGAYLFATVTDPQAQQRVVQQMLLERFNPHHIKNPAAQQRLRSALEYYAAMQKLMLSRLGASRAEFQNVLDEIDDWIAELYNLGQRIDQFDENAIINRDRMRSRNELDALNRRLNAETDERVKEELRRSIEIKKTQLENLQNLEANVKRADIQMDNTLAAMGTVYAQMQLIGSKSIDSSRAQRLRNEIHDQVMGLQDTIAAIDEVHSASRP